MSDITITKTWLDANFSRLFNQANRFLKMKIKHNDFGSCSEEMLSDYYLVACKNDRLKSRLTLNDDGTVTETKPITASGLALYAYNVMFDQLDKKARKNLDIARCWDATTETDKGILKTLKQHYTSPSHSLFEAVCTVSDSGEVTYELSDSEQATAEDGLDRLDAVEQRAMIQAIAKCTAHLSSTGKLLDRAEESVWACLYGWRTQDFADYIGCHQTKGRRRMRIARQAIDYWANVHREAHRILTIKSKGGHIGSSCDPDVVDLLVAKGMLTEGLQITEKGRHFSMLPQVPRLFKESLSYYLVDLEVELPDVVPLPEEYNESMKAKKPTKAKK